MKKEIMLQESHGKARRTWVLVLGSLASFMVSLDALVVATALSTIHRDLGVSLEALEWTVNAYTLSFAVLLITAAALGDRFGRRRMFVIGLAIFVVSSAACALSRNVGWLIAAPDRAYPAFIAPLLIAVLGVSMALPSVQNAVISAVAPSEIGTASGTFSMVRQLGGAFGVAIVAAVFAGFGSYASA
jgi:MFS family permease